VCCAFRYKCIIFVRPAVVYSAEAEPIMEMDFASVVYTSVMMMMHVKIAKSRFQSQQTVPLIHGYPAIGTFKIKQQKILNQAPEYVQTACGSFILDHALLSALPVCKRAAFQAFREMSDNERTDLTTVSVKSQCVNAVVMWYSKNGPEFFATRSVA